MDHTELTPADLLDDKQFLRLAESARSVLDNILKAWKNDFIGRTCVLTMGKYMGRVGVCTDISIGMSVHGPRIKALVHPYRTLDRGDKLPGDAVLVDDPEARTYWPVDNCQWFTVRDERFMEKEEGKK
jgi:hypothetical protein